MPEKLGAWSRQSCGAVVTGYWPYDRFPARSTLASERSDTVIRNEHEYRVSQDYRRRLLETRAIYAAHPTADATQRVWLVSGVDQALGDVEAELAEYEALRAGLTYPASVAHEDAMKVDLPVLDGAERLQGSDDDRHVGREDPEKP